MSRCPVCRQKGECLDTCGVSVDELLPEINQLEQELAKHKEALKVASEAIEFYANQRINQHNYHSAMDTDLTVKARKAQQKINEIMKGSEE